MSRAITWSLLVLVFSSSVAVAVDLADRSADTIVFTVPPLTAGSRAVYDLTVISDFHGDHSTAGGLVVEVDEATLGEHGKEEARFVLRVERDPMPWDLEEPALARGAGAAVGAAVTTVTEETVRLADGRVLHRDTTHHDQRWRSHSGTEYLDEAMRHDVEHAADGSGPWSALRAHLSHRYSYRDPSLPDASHGDDVVEVTRARYGNHTVYGWTQTHTGDVENGQRFGCELRLPHHTYAEETATAQHSRMDLKVTSRETYWVSPDHTFPLLSTCETTYRHGGPDGGLAGQIRVVAHLQDEVRDGPPILLPPPSTPYDPLPMDPIPAVPRTSGGLPADPQTLFRFPLADAYTVLIESDHEALAPFRGSDDPPFIVLSAAYQPDVAEQQRCTLPEPLCMAAPGTAETTSMAAPAWTFQLQNERDEQMKVRVERQITATGEGLPPEISLIAPHKGEILSMQVDQIPTSLVSPSRVLLAWADHADIDLESWRADPSAFFTIHYERQADKVVPHYVIEASSEPTDPGADKGPLGGPEDMLWTGTLHHRYDGVNGVLLDHGSLLQRSGKAQQDTQEPSPFIDHQARLTDFEHVPIAGIIVGTITLAGLATALRTGLPDWLRRALFLPLFTKLSKKKVLDHKTRDEMITFVARNPGIGTEDIRKHFGIGWGTAVYHLSALEQNDLLTSLRMGGHRHWFPTKALDAATKQMHALLRSPATSRLYQAIVEDPGRTQQEIAERLGVTHGAVIFQVRKLQNAGLIRKERDGRFVRYHPEPLSSGTEQRTSPRTD